MGTSLALSVERKVIMGASGWEIDKGILTRFDHRASRSDVSPLGASAGIRDPATNLGLRGFDGLTATYGAAAVMLVLLYPVCRWYRSRKAADRNPC